MNLISEEVRRAIIQMTREEFEPAMAKIRKMVEDEVAKTLAELDLPGIARHFIDQSAAHIVRSQLNRRLEEIVDQEEEEYITEGWRLALDKLIELSRQKENENNVGSFI